MTKCCNKGCNNQLPYLGYEIKIMQCMECARSNPIYKPFIEPMPICFERDTLAVESLDMSMSVSRVTGCFSSDKSLRVKKRKEALKKNDQD